MNPCGVLVLDKPEGPTSHDMVRLARRLLRTRQVGHTGTLDPMATGVLVLCVGRATRLARFLTAGEKVYRARLRLGQATDTYDRTGTPVGPRREPPRDGSKVRQALHSLRGRRPQVPPAFSAKRIGGVRAHRLARAGAPAAPRPVEVEIHEFRDIAVDGDEVGFEVRCSPGTYVRSLAQEVGELLSCGAHLTELRRVRNGEFDLEQARTPGEVHRLARAGRAAATLVPLQALRMGMPSVVARAGAVAALAHGRALQAGDWEGRPPAAPGPCRVLGPDGRLLAVAAVEAAPGSAARLLPRLVLVAPGPGPGPEETS